MRINDLVKQLNLCKRVQDTLFGEIELGVKTRNHEIHPEGLYKKNEQSFYTLLRCCHELESFLERQNAVLTPDERTYFERLVHYTKSLLKTNRLFPKLSYFFWQRSLGKNQDRFYQHAFDVDWNRSRSFRVKAQMSLRKIQRV